MELGVANSIATKHFSSDNDIDLNINDWLLNNPDVEIIDIKFSTSISEENWGSDALIIYRL